MPSADDEMLSRLPTSELIDHAHVRYRKTIGLSGSVEFTDARNVIPHLIERIEKLQAQTVGLKYVDLSKDKMP